MQHYKQYHMTVLLNNFHLNGHTLGFHPLTKNVRTTLDNITNRTMRSYCPSAKFGWYGKDAPSPPTPRGLPPTLIFILRCRITFALSTGLLPWFWTRHEILRLDCARLVIWSRLLWKDWPDFVSLTFCVHGHEDFPPKSRYTNFYSAIGNQKQELT